MNPSQSIKDRFNKQGQFKIDSDDAFVRIHHILMKEYGWIPLEEYAGSEETITTEYVIPMIIPKPWYKPWLWKIENITFKASTTRTKQGLPLATIWNLLDCIKEDREEEKRHMEKAKRKK